jgi:hypothetical protein
MIKNGLLLPIKKISAADHVEQKHHRPNRWIALLLTVLPYVLPSFLGLDIIITTGSIFGWLARTGLRG